jgi:hypothetical protein
MDSPIVVIQAGEREFFSLSSLLHEVRASRFYLQPGEDGYRVELIHEKEGWSKSNAIKSCVWRAGRTTSADQAYRAHFEHVEGAFGLPSWEKRTDVPAWFRDIALVLSIHGMHWTGYIFNDCEDVENTGMGGHSDRATTGSRVSACVGRPLLLELSDLQTRCEVGRT